MNKRDRMVVAMGVSLLLITGMGIFFFPNDTAVDTPEETQETIYTVVWIPASDTVTDSDYIGRDGWRKEYTLQMGDGAVIDSVTVSLDWYEAFNPHGLFLSWNWSDKIEASITVDELQCSQTISGYEKIQMTATNTVPQKATLETANKAEIDRWIHNQTTDTLSCIIDMSITPKPWPFDRGNDFTLRITYHYLTPSITTT
ncbi:MAG: hypothetical protein ACP5FL_06005 [Thermoplasmatota archaeon]